MSPKSFGDGFWRLAFVDATVNSFTLGDSIGYPLNHWATLAYQVAAAWPPFALSARWLHDSGRLLTFATLAALALPFADTASLASDYGALDIFPAATSSLPGILIFGAWARLMWDIYRLPSGSGASWLGLPPGD